MNCSSSSAVITGIALYSSEKVRSPAFRRNLALPRFRLKAGLQLFIFSGHCHTTGELLRYCVFSFTVASTYNSPNAQAKPCSLDFAKVKLCRCWIELRDFGSPSPKTILLPSLRSFFYFSVNFADHAL